MRILLDESLPGDLVVVLRARNNRIQALETLPPELLQLLSHIAPKTLRTVGA